MIRKTLLLAACAYSSSCMPSELDAYRELSAAQNPLYVGSSRLWPAQDIPVCWENATAGNLTGRLWVQDAVSQTWQREAAVAFVGWGNCLAGASGIHIRIEDTGPHAKKLGSGLNGMKDGLVLNFTYSRWSPGCATTLESCTRAVAVHEFGHALGFAHEQNRPDTPRTCRDAPQGENGDIIVGSWDLGSVMNYCNPSWNNGGSLSKGDIEGAVGMYGPARSRPQRWLAEYGASAGGWHVDRHLRVMADVNGDGRADVVGFGESGVSVALSTGTGFSTPLLAIAEFGATAGSWRVDRHPRMMADVNGDGQADVVGFGESGVTLALSTGTGFSTPFLAVAEFGAATAAGGWRVGPHLRMMADVNGDGRADVVGFGESGVTVALSIGAGFLTPFLAVAAYGTTTSAGGWHVDRHLRMMADVNGDGRADIVGFAESGVIVALSTGTGFSTPFLAVAEFGATAGSWRVDRHSRMMADVNGDGRADVVGFGESGVIVALSTGTGFSTPFLAVAEFGAAASAGGWRVGRHLRMMADINGDGRADVIGFGETATMTGFSSGSVLSASTMFVRNYTPIAGGWLTKNQPRLLADVNGDGKTDVIGFDAEGTLVSVAP